MEDTVSKGPTAEEAVEIQAAIQQIFEQIEQADARIKADQDDIDQLKMETRAMLAQLRSDTGA
jgi:hypothetical protein